VFLIPVEKKYRLSVGGPWPPPDAAVLCNSNEQSLLPCGPRYEEADCVVIITPAGGWKCLAHRLFSLDVVPSDFHFCWSLKKHLKRKNYWCDDVKPRLCPWLSLFSTPLKLDTGVSLGQISQLVWWLRWEVDGLPISACCFGCRRDKYKCNTFGCFWWAVWRTPKYNVS
jgi:hypothetical protein